MPSMKWRAVVALLSLSILATTAVADAASDAAQIRAAFSQYKEALLEGDGEKAAEVVSARTIAYYDGIRTHVLTTPREKLAELDLISKFMVLRIRHEFTRAEMVAMNGRQLLITGVDRGWISKSSVANIEELVNIKAGATEASAAIPAGPEIPLFQFLKESGQWKLNLEGSFALANEALKYAVTKSGLTEEQFIMRMLGSVSSRKVEDRIFSPLVE